MTSIIDLNGVMVPYRFERNDDQIWFPPKAVSCPEYVKNSVVSKTYIKCQKLGVPTVLTVRACVAGVIYCGVNPREVDKQTKCR